MPDEKEMAALEKDPINYLQSQAEDFLPSPLIVSHAKGSYFYDVQGKGYLDAMSGYFTNCLGYSDPELCQVLFESSQRLSSWHQYDTTHVFAIDYVRELMAKVPEELRGKLLFSDSGSGAIEIALRVACAVLESGQRKARLVRLGRGYHGSTFLTQYLSDPRFNDWPSALKLFSEEPLTLKSPLNDSTAEKALTQFEEFCRSENPPNLMVTEPIQWVGGGVFPPGAFFDQLGTLCRKYDVLWISDEISTGFGPTGKLFAFERQKTLPDIVVIGKRMAAGYARLSGVVVAKKISHRVLEGKHFHHGYTLSAHPVACAIARVVLRRVTELLPVVEERGNQLKKGLELLRGEFPSLKSIQGMGLSLSIELPDSKSAKYLTRFLLQKGVYQIPQGKYLVFSPPFIITQEQIEFILSILKLGLSELPFRNHSSESVSTDLSSPSFGERIDQKDPIRHLEI